MSNKVFDGLDTFYTDTSYNSETGVLSVFNRDHSNTFDIQLVRKVSYSDLTGQPNIYVNSGEPTFALSEDSVYIDSDTGRVWSGVNGVNLKMRDPDTDGLLLDKFEDIAEDYTNKIVRADDGNLYTQIVENVTTTPTEVKLIGTPVLDVHEDTFDRVTFESLVVDNIYYYDRDTIGIIDETVNTTYTYSSTDNALSISNMAGTALTINGSDIKITGNILGIIGTPYSFTLSDTSVVKPYYDSVVILDATKLLVLEPAGDIISAVDTEHLLKPIIADINISDFMYIDGLLVFFSITQNKYYVVDVIAGTILENSTSFDIQGKKGVLLDNGYIYYIQDTTHIYGFYALEVSWKRVGIDDILPSKFCNSLKLTDVVSIDNNVLNNIKNANGTDIVHNITSLNGFIYFNAESSSHQVTRVEGISTMTTTTSVNSTVFSSSIVGLAPFNNSIAVGLSNNSITLLDTTTLVVESTYDFTDVVDGDIISMTSLPEHLYVLTDANKLYVFDEVNGSNPVATYTVGVSGGLTNICVFNPSSFALTDIDGVSTGVYEMRIGKTGDVQVSTRVVISNTTYPSIFKYLGKLAVMNGNINTDVSLYNLHNQLRRV